MAYRSKDSHFHLTPIGWTAEEIAPSYTVETWRFSVYQEFPWSREQQVWRRIWHSMAWSETERERLNQKFPPPVQVSPASVAQPSAEVGERKRA